MRKKVMDVYNSYSNQDKKIRGKNLSLQIVMEFFNHIISLFIKLYLLITGINRQYLIGDITKYLNTIDYLMSNLSTLLMTLSGIAENNLYISSIFNFLEGKVENEKDKGLSFDSNFKKIVFKNVNFKYPGKKDLILKNINLEIEKGKSYLIVGGNGAGKTTLIKLLIALYQPTSGDIYIDEKNLMNMT